MSPSGSSNWDSACKPDHTRSGPTQEFGFRQMDLSRRLSLPPEARIRRERERKKRSKENVMHCNEMEGDEEEEEEGRKGGVGGDV